VSANWSTAPSTDTFYEITQAGKFPRAQDVTSHNSGSTVTWYKTIPEAVRRAVAAQVEFIINMGDDFFGSDTSDKQSESIGDYSYTRGAGTGNLARLIAPKAKLLLRGYIRRSGSLVL
jgi:hypothetical protein